MRRFDLIIVGTGSANSILGPEFADRRVALVERGTFGGTCLNVGCIPTKMFVHTADLAATPAKSSRYGVDETLDAVRWPAIRDRIFGRIDPISAGGREYRATHADNNNVTLFAGNARFTGLKQLTITPTDGGEPEVITADEIVIGAGSRPVVPTVDGLAELDFHTSDTVMRLAELPRRLTILGSGFIAAEFAHVFSSLGVDVTVIARSGALLREQDTDVSVRFTELARQRWDVRLNRKAIRAEALADGTRRLHLEGPDGAETVDSDQLLVAVGRTPNTDQLDVAAAGLATTDDGRLVVDQYQRTTVDGIWALGDISSPWQLKHVANHEERVVRHNLLNQTNLRAVDHRYVPQAVFSSPQIASVGLTERAAVERGVSFVTATQDYADIAYGWAMEDTTGFAKILADPDTGLLLGAHIIGPQASTLIQPLIQAMSLGQTADQLTAGQYWIHPAMPELIENALLKLALSTPASAH